MTITMWFGGAGWAKLPVRAKKTSAAALRLLMTLVGYVLRLWCRLYSLPSQFDICHCARRAQMRRENVACKLGVQELASRRQVRVSVQLRANINLPSLALT